MAYFGFKYGKDFKKCAAHIDPNLREALESTTLPVSKNLDFRVLPNSVVLGIPIYIFFLLFLLRMSSSCIHVTALLFRIEAANRNGLTNPACTSRQCVWNVSVERTAVQPTRICNMDFKASKLKKSMYLYKRKIKLWAEPFKLQYFHIQSPYISRYVWKIRQKQ